MQIGVMCSISITNHANIMFIKYLIGFLFLQNKCFTTPFLQIKCKNAHAYVLTFVQNKIMFSIEVINH